MILRRISKQINIGNVAVGGTSPISVQSMANTDTRDVMSTINQIKELEEADCEIIRVAVPDMQAAEALKGIKKGISIPLIADIHFDYRLALAALKAGVDGLRLNPGNISEPEKVKAVVKAAKERRVPIRVGVNAGSLPKNVNPLWTTAQNMVEAALEQVRLLESLDFDLIKVSLKAFDVPTTIAAYQDIAQRIPYPLHIGITEAGTPRTGVIRSAVGIGVLLAEGIGDTIRVSLATEPAEEVRVAYEILKSLDVRARGVNVIACPTCGRLEVDLFKIVAAIEKHTAHINEPLNVAVMGCAVNGPGEARTAHLGVACGRGNGVIYREGISVKRVPEDRIVPELVKEIESYVAEKRNPPVPASKSAS